MESPTCSSSSESSLRNDLSDKWVLWAHLPHDTDWSLRSYKKIMQIGSVEEIIALYETLPEKMVKNCMLFLMKLGINPMWEDQKNKDGGCFSFKVSNKNVYRVWRDLSYKIVGNTVSNNEELLSIINGLTISPKKSFCIVKIWLENCKIQTPSNIKPVNNLDMHGCLFKRHKPNY